MKRKKKKVTAVEAVEIAEPATKSNKSIKIWILSIIAAVVGLAIIATGIIIPIALNDEYVKGEMTLDEYYSTTNTETQNPYAIIKLSNGMELEFDIWEKECPNAATNFIYLAEIGYFDGTVIFDAQGGWVRLGGWETENGAAIHRGDSNEKFLSGIVRKEDRQNNKFGYRLKEDTAKSNYWDTAGVLSFCYERSATEFQIATSGNQSLTIPDDADGDWKVAPFAMASNAETIDNINAIAALALDDSGNFTHDYYRAPLDEDKLITIKSVKVRRKYAQKWKSFDFNDWIYDEEDGSSRRYSWYSNKKTTGTRR